MAVEDLGKKFTRVIRQQDKRQTSPYDSVGKVIRVEDGIAWVHLAGGVDETPVRLTVNARRGDSVQVRISGGRAWIVGNATAPPTDDATAIVAHNVARTAEYTANGAKEVADEALDDAKRAKVAAESAEESATQAAASATSAQGSAQIASQSASSAGENASRAQAAAQAAETAALETITTDTLHYLATSQGSGVTRETAGWSTTVQTMTSTNKYLWTYHTYTSANGTTTDTTPVITGTYGEKGADGTSVTILGSYNSVAELEAAHPTGNLGDAYMVGGDLYIWNGTAWENVGQIKGDKGDTGATGPQGEQGTSGADGDDGVSVTAVQPQYYLSTSASIAQGGTWGNSLSYVVGKYIWTRDRITYSDTNIDYSDEIYNQALTKSCSDAAEALGIVEEQQEYFWHDSLGAHVLSDTDDVTGVRYRTDIKGAGQEIFKLNTDGTESSMSKFGETVRLGMESGSHMNLDSDSIEFMDGNTQIGYVGADSAKFPIMHVSSRMSVGNKYEWRVTPSGSLGLYLM